MRPRRSPCSTTGAAAATTPNASAGCPRCSTRPADPGSAPTWPTPRPWPRSSAAAQPAPSTTACRQRNPRNQPIQPPSPVTRRGRCWSGATWSWTPPRDHCARPGPRCAPAAAPRTGPSVTARAASTPALWRHPGPGGDIPPGALNQRPAPLRLHGPLAAPRQPEPGGRGGVSPPPRWESPGRQHRCGFGPGAAEDHAHQPRAGGAPGHLGCFAHGSCGSGPVDRSRRRPKCGVRRQL